MTRPAPRLFDGIACGSRVASHHPGFREAPRVGGLLLLASLALGACKPNPNLVVSNENDALKCEIAAAGKAGPEGVGYDVTCTAKVPEVKIVNGTVTYSAYFKEGGKSVSRPLGEVRVVSAPTTVTPAKPLKLEGVVPRQSSGVSFDRPTLRFSADLNYGDADVRKDMDYDAVKIEEANNKRKYQILASTRL